MVYKCCIPYCKSGYNSNVEKVIMFRVPKDENILKLWQQVIPRKDKLVSTKDRVCNKHFRDEDLIKVWTDGANTIPLQQYRLKEDAVPSIFPGCPKYLNVKPIKKRRTIIKHEIPIKKIKPVDTDNKEASSTSINERDINVFDVDVCTSSSSKQYTEAELIFTLIWSGKIMLPNEFWSHSKILKNENQFTAFTKYTISHDDGIPVVEKQVIIDSSLTIKYIVMQEMYNNDIFPMFVTSVHDFENTLTIFNDLNVCKGGPSLSIYPESELLSRSKLKYFDKKVNAWRHTKCTKLLSASDIQECRFCKTLHKVLYIQNKRQKTKKLKTIDIIRRTAINQKKKLYRLSTKFKSLNKHLAEIKKNISKIEISDLEMKLDELGISKLQKMSILQCLNACKSSKKGVRYNQDWLLVCLLLHIKNPNSYRFLRDNQILPLPHSRTIRRYLYKINVKCGVDEEFFKAFGAKLQKRNPYQRHGLLIFDEMSVQKEITVNVKNMNLLGLEDFGDHKKTNSTTSIADHALVFLFAPLADSYAQPVCVYAACGPTKGNILALLIIEIIRKLENAGAFVDGVICDGASTNRRMWTEFGVSGIKDHTNNKILHPVDDQRYLYFFSDTPHLFKCIRNRLIDQDLHTPEGVVSWKFYENLYLHEKDLPGHLKVCKNITQNHIYPSNMQKMKVKYATQIFSNSVSTGINFYRVRQNEWSMHSEATISVTKMLNDVFDALNRSRPLEGVRKNSKDLEIIRTFLEWLDRWEMSLIDNAIMKNQFLTKSTAEGLRVTLISTLELCDYLMNDCDFTYILTAKVNQDVIERFFGTIRQAAGANEHPTFTTFLYLYRMLSVYHLVKPPKMGNCTAQHNDTDARICDLSSTEFNQIFSAKKDRKEELINNLKIKLDGLIEDNNEYEISISDHNYAQSEVSNCILYYVTGFLCSKFLKKISCTNCRLGLKVDASENDGLLDNIPEAQLTNMKTRGFLTHVNKSVFNLCQYTEEKLMQHIESPDVYEETIFAITQDYAFSFPCPQHKLEILSKLIHEFILMRLRQYFRCKKIDQKTKCKEDRKKSKLHSQ